MTLVGYVPARSGSKRLKNKNFRNFYNGISMAEIALQKSKKNKKIFFTLLDTNNDIFLEQMKSKNLTDYFRKREKTFGKDNSSTKESLIDCIQKAEKDLKIEIDSIAILQPTSPLISSNSIELIIDKFQRSKVDLIASFTYLPFNLNDCIAIKKNAINKIKLDHSNSDKFLFETGGMYIIKKSRLFNKSKPFCIDSLNNIYKIPLTEFIDVDYEDQFELAQNIYRNLKK